MSKLKSELLYIPIYRRCIKVYVASYNKVCKKLSLETFPGTVAFVMRYRKKKYSMIVCLPKNVGVETIAHEAAHITNMILYDAGYVLNLDNDEAHAYLLGTVTAGLYEIHQKLK
jgi:hypothetical protein